MPSPVSAPGGGGPPFDPNVRHVLRLLGGSTMQHLKCGYLWPNGPVDLGLSMLWRAILRAFSGGIIITDGYGGAHALGWLISTVPGVQSGNIWDGSASVSFTGTYQINTNEWVDLALVFNGTPGFQKIWTYVDGVCDGEAVLTARAALPYSGGNGYLGIGGMDHQCIGADLAFVEGWDRANSPFKPNYPIAFVPNRYPNPTSGLVSGVPPGVLADFQMDCTVPGLLMDRSPRGAAGGVSPDLTNHPGVYVGYGGQATDRDEWEGWAGAAGLIATPRWEADPTCPFKMPLGSPLPNEITRTPKSVPSGALAYDSCGRRNQTWFTHAVPSIGSTEGGSLGPLAWQFGVVAPDAPNLNRGGATWLLFDGSLVHGDDAPNAAWINLGTARQDVRVSRRTTAGNNGETGLCFRLVDRSNYWQACYSAALGGIWVGYWEAGSFTHVNTFNPGATGWKRLRVTAVGDTISIYADDLIGGWVLQGTFTDTKFNTATRAGVCTPSLNIGNSLARHDEFEAQPI